MVDRTLLFANEMTGEDAKIAAAYGVNITGSHTNIGIYGGFQALSDDLDTDILLLVENDCPLIVDQATVAGVIERAVADMADGTVPIFNLRSRHQPGYRFTRSDKYRAFYRLRAPLDSSMTRISVWSRLRAMCKYGNGRQFAAMAVYLEVDPVVAQPQVLRRSAHGNWLSDSQCHNWTNQSILVRRDFYRGVILERVRTHPDPRTINGHQDIERAVNGRWWRRQRFPIGFSDPGAFTHARPGQG